jgi:hypothetical protein
MLQNKITKLWTITPIIIWICYVVWWVVINYTNGGNVEGAVRDNYTDTYSIIALLGSIVGVTIAKKWGLLKSIFGKTLFYFSIGLLLQFFGQFTYALYFRIGHIELAFPNIGDLFYISTSFAYILAVYYLLKVVIIKKGIFTPRWVLITSLAATGVLAWLSYISFLNLAIQDERGLIYQVLNVAYPLVQAFYFILGFIALMQSKRLSGGKLFRPVSFILLALFVQYLADFTFLYTSYHQAWEAAGTNDLIYVLAYGFMIVAIIMVDRVRISTTPQQTSKNEIEQENG